jgi:hypothetical protein
MNLKKLKWWPNHQESMPEQAINPLKPESDGEKGDKANVVSLFTGNPIDNPAGLVSPNEFWVRRRPELRGLLDGPEIKGFLEKNHAASGRYQGSVYGTQESLNLGIAKLVSEFQNTLEELKERRKVKHQRLHMKLLETQGAASGTSEMLEFAKATVSQELNLLESQIASAEAGKGWIEEALNSYKLGFNRGLREAIEFDLI